MSMFGKPTVPFSQLFIDTVATHGTHWAHAHYVTRHGMPAWEFRMWLKSTYRQISKQRALVATSV
jgi:hypothetical protein